MDLAAVLFFLLAMFGGYYAVRWVTVTGQPH